MLDGVRRALHRIVVEGRVPHDRVIVLSPFGVKRSLVWEARTFGNLRLVSYPAPPGPNEVPFSTLQGFKGLEADAVVLCEVRPHHKASSAQHLYVGASRARHVLAVIQERVSMATPPTC
jgi:hypothetical protein